MVEWTEIGRISFSVVGPYRLEAIKTMAGDWAFLCNHSWVSNHDTKEQAQSAAIAEATRRAAAVLLAVGWPDDGANDAADAVLFKGGTVHAALTAALKEAAGE